MSLRTASWITAAACGLALAACAGRSEITAGPEYPLAKPQSHALSVQVFRQGTRIRFANTTARSYPAGRMWLNRWYSRDVPQLAVGQSMDLPLRDFKDKFGEPFRAGGFFAVDKPDRLVLAQLELDDHMLGLVVVESADE